MSRTVFFLLAVFAASATADAGALLIFTDPVAWRAAVDGTIATEDFASFPAGNVESLETTYGDLTLTVDRIWEPSTPGITGNHELLLNTFDAGHPSYPNVPGPTYNDLSFPEPITAFGAHFRQAGVTGTDGNILGDFNVTFADTVVTISDILIASNGTGFLGLVSPAADTTLRFQNVATGALVNDLVFISSVSYAVIPEPITVAYLIAGFLVLARGKSARVPHPSRSEGWGTDGASRRRQS